jgi:cell division initiation protein
MKVTPVDIHHKTIASQTFGLNKEEVKNFLMDVASEMEKLIHERNHLKEALREKEMSIMEYKERDKVLNQTIATAAQMAEKMNAEAQKEAMNIRKEAELQAQSMLHETRDQLKVMYKEIMDLKKMRLQFEMNMKSLAQAHIDLIEKIQFTQDGGVQVNPQHAATTAPPAIAHSAPEARA